MIAERRTSLTMLVLLGALVFVYHFGNAFYQASGIEPLPTFEFLYSAAFLCGVVWWLKAEVGRSRFESIYCSGLLVSMGWLIILPYSLFRKHGVKGFIPLLVLLASLMVARVSGAIVYLILGYAY